MHASNRLRAGLRFRRRSVTGTNFKKNFRRKSFREQYFLRNLATDGG
jgi:hypothetical protein